MTLSCDEASGAIARRADGAAETAGERARLDAHLLACASCRAALEAQQSVSNLLRSRESETLSPAFASRLAARLDDASGWFGLLDWRVWTFRLAPVAAGLALAAYLTTGSASDSGAAITLNDWAAATTAQSEAALLWQQDVTSDSLLESMLAGGSGSGSGNDVR